MSLDKVRWGFIGCGDVAEKKSGPAFNQCEGSEIVAVMSRTPDRARKYAARHGIDRWYTDAQKLIDDPHVNAVYVATPPSSHATFAIMAMNAGKPVYVEKPLASTYDDCIRIKHVSEHTGMPCFCAYYRRELPYFLKVKEILRSGTIGDIINVQIRFACPPRPEDRADNLPWRVRPEIAGGGYFYDLAPHQIDLLQDFFGVITHAKGIWANRGGLYQAEDSVSACFRFENGLPGSGSWVFVGHESAAEDRIEIIGSHGIVCFSVFSFSPIHVHTNDGMQTIDVPNPEFVQQPLIQSVVNHLRGEGLCSCDVAQATSVNWVLDRIMKKL